MKRFLFISLCCSLLVLAGCSTSPKTTGTIDLIGEWSILSANGMSTAEGMTPAFIAFDSIGNVHGNASVNSFFGGYILSGDSLSFSPMGMTRMMGPNIEIEDAVIDAINHIAIVRVDADTATLYNISGEPIMLWQKR